MQQKVNIPASEAKLATYRAKMTEDDFSATAHEKIHHPPAVATRATSQRMNAVRTPRREFDAATAHRPAEPAQPVYQPQTEIETLLMNTYGGHLGVAGPLAKKYNTFQDASYITPDERQSFDQMFTDLEKKESELDKARAQFRVWAIRAKSKIGNLPVLTDEAADKERPAEQQVPLMKAALA